MKNFYNTTHESGQMLIKLTQKTANQECEILDIFKRSPVGKTPSEVWINLSRKYPLTSIRRAITNLTKDDMLEKTIVKRPGVYGRNEYIWTVKR